MPGTALSSRAAGSEDADLLGGLRAGSLGLSAGRRHGAVRVHHRLDAVGDALGGLAQLRL